MGQGEYGGNGSVHWLATHKKDRNHGNGQNAHTYHEVDEHPPDTVEADFTVVIFGVESNWIDLDDSTARVSYDPTAKTLTVRVPIKRDPDNYERQILISWPNP